MKSPSGVRRDRALIGLAAAAASVIGAVTIYSLSGASASSETPAIATAQEPSGISSDCWDGSYLDRFLTPSGLLPNLVSFQSNGSQPHGVPDPCQGGGDGDGGNGDGDGGNGGGGGGGGTTTTTIPAIEPVTFKMFAAYGWLDASFAYSGTYPHSASDFEVTGTCNGVAVTNNVDSEDCSTIQVVVEYGLLGSKFDILGYPSAPGRNAWKHIYSGPGLDCTETKVAATSTTAGTSTFDCTPTGTETSTYFMVIGMQTAWDFNFFTLNQGFVIDYNFHSFGAITAPSWTSGNIGSDWSPGNLGGTSGLKACKVVSSVVTTDCEELGPSSFWVLDYREFLDDRSVTWEFSLLDPTKTSESYALFDKDTNGTYRGTVTSTNAVRADTTGMEEILMLYRAVTPP